MAVKSRPKPKYIYLPTVSNIYNHSLHLHCKYRAQKHASVEAEKKGEVKWNTDFTETEPGLLCIDVNCYEKGKALALAASSDWT